MPLGPGSSCSAIRPCEPGSELSVLELADVAGTDAISPDEPLIIQVDGVMEPASVMTILT